MSIQREKAQPASITAARNVTQDVDAPDETPVKRGRGRPPNVAKVGSAWVISDQAKAALERCELFQDLTRQQLMAVAALVEERAFEPEEMLIREGDPTRRIFVLAEGSAAAQLQMEHGWMSLGLLGRGDVAGWSALVDVKAYPASVKALTPLKAAGIDAEGLKLLMSVEPGIGYPIHRRLSAIFCRQYEAALRALKTTG